MVSNNNSYLIITICLCTLFYNFKYSFLILIIFQQIYLTHRWILLLLLVLLLLLQLLLHREYNQHSTPCSNSVYFKYFNCKNTFTKDKNKTLNYIRKKPIQSKQKKRMGSLVGCFYGISTLVGYLMPNSVHKYNIKYR